MWHVYIRAATWVSCCIGGMDSIVPGMKWLRCLAGTVGCRSIQQVHEEPRQGQCIRATAQED